jgi:hypothetical protein
MCTDVHAALFAMHGNWKPPKCPSTGDWLSKLGDIHAEEIMQLSGRMRNTWMCVDVEGCPRPFILSKMLFKCLPYAK